MTKENENKLAKFLKANADKNNMAWINVLCHDQVDDKRLDIEMVYDQGKIFIGGDQGEIYEFSELEIIDERVLKF